MTVHLLGNVAVVNSVYDALGFLTPITLKGKMLLRKLVELGNQKHVESPTLGWDDPLPVSLNREWEHWRSSLIHFKNVLIPRCYHGKEFCQVTTLLKKGVLKQHTFYVQKTTHLKVCYSSTPLGVLFACPENNTPLGVF